MHFRNSYCSTRLWPLGNEHTVEKTRSHKAYTSRIHTLRTHYTLVSLHKTGAPRSFSSAPPQHLLYHHRRRPLICSFFPFVSSSLPPPTRFTVTEHFEPIPCHYYTYTHAQTREREKKENVLAYSESFCNFRWLCVYRAVRPLKGWASEREKLVTETDKENAGRTEKEQTAQKERRTPRAL